MQEYASINLTVAVATSPEKDEDQGLKRKLPGSAHTDKAQKLEQQQKLQLEL